MDNSIISALGYGSGLDTTALVKSLAAAAKAPKDSQIKIRETAVAASISSLGEVSGGIDAFAKAMKTLVTGGTLVTQPTSSNLDVVTVSAMSGARLGDLSAQLEVKQLAQTQTLNSAVAASRVSTVGKGKLSFTVAGKITELTIDSSNNTLSGVAAAINGSKAGVTASIVNDGAGVRLVLKGATGATNAFTMTATPAAPEMDGNGAPIVPAVDLADLSYDPAVTGGLSQVQEAKDAIVVLDGVELRRSVNAIPDLIPGVRFDLKTAAVGKTISIGSARPTEAITQAVNDFTAVFNDMKGLLDDATRAAGPDGTGAGPLRGDTGMRDLQRRLSRITSTPLVSGGTGPKTLAEIGVVTNRDGSLRVDAARLAATIASDPDGVEALFNPIQRSSSPFVTVTSATGATAPGSYTLTDLVPQSGSTVASGFLGGIAMTRTENSLSAPSNSAAKGLIVQATAAVSSVTIGIDLGLGGALQSIRDALRASTGSLASTSSRLSKESTALAAERTKMNARNDAYFKQLTAQYAQMEVRVSASKATETYLKQQVDSWNSN